MEKKKLYLGGAEVADQAHAADAVDKRSESPWASPVLCVAKSDS